MSEFGGVRIHVRGVVQGVGFRPFVFGLALRHSLTGWVRNTSAGVDIELDGAQDVLDAFVRDLRQEAPPLAHIDGIEVRRRPVNGYSEFEILESAHLPVAFQPISPDVAICDDCLRELFDPVNRRYRYPFINCTNCGPRFTIIRDIPYDRPNTTMGSFPMCPACSSEYSNPLDRRFHAQPVACPACGPHVWLTVAGRRTAERDDAIGVARKLLQEGRVVALRGLGGFHLACDATQPEAVAELRRRKLRVDKPFAVMLFDSASVASQCELREPERNLLESRERPVVILPRKEKGSIAGEVAPGQNTLGVMLPYTPLHYLLLEPAPGSPPALVMTSGNLSEEPIATTNEEALERLSPLVDAFLLHDRDIHIRCDDSVVRLYPAVKRSDPGSAADSQGSVLAVRRARGYAPLAVYLPWEGKPLLAVGAQLKNTFCLTRGEYAFMSHHIGDLENYETLQSFEQAIDHYQRLLRIRPEAISCDLHPDYLATRYASDRSQREGLPTVAVQHHHAHIAACMVENGLGGDRPVLGISFDGTGYGDDGTVWGGEILLCDLTAYRRLFHLSAVPLPGGEMAVREPWRMALVWLDRAGIAWEEDLPPVCRAPEASRRVLQHLVAEHDPGSVTAPLTSSMGRLFDAVSSLVGVRHETNYEGQAAMELEALVDPREEGGYLLEVRDGILDPVPAIQQAVGDLRQGVEVGRIAARFHQGIARAVLEVGRSARDAFAVREIALSGGVWQNRTLLGLTLPLLQEDGFTVYFHTKVPPNDGGLALGQAAIAQERIRRGLV
jgi:hydrogenase maturation protein HypF